MAEAWFPRYAFEAPKEDNSFMESIKNLVVPDLNDHVTQAIGEELLHKLAVAPTPEMGWGRSGERSHLNSPDLYNIQQTLIALLSYLQNASISPEVTRHRLDSFIASVNHTVSFCAASHDGPLNKETKQAIQCGQTLTPDLQSAVQRLEAALADDMMIPEALSGVSEEAGGAAREVLRSPDESLMNAIHDFKNAIVRGFELTDANELITEVRRDLDYLLNELTTFSNESPEMDERLEEIRFRFEALDRELGNDLYNRNAVLADFLIQLGILTEFLDSNREY